MKIQDLTKVKEVASLAGPGPGWGNSHPHGYMIERHAKKLSDQDKQYFNAVF